MYHSSKLIILFLSMMIFPISASAADSLKISKEAVQKYGGCQSQNAAGIVARIRSEHLAFQEVGNYLEKLKIVVENKIPKENLPAIASGVCDVEYTKDDAYNVQGNLCVKFITTIVIDPISIERRFKTLFSNSELKDMYIHSYDEENELLKSYDILVKKNEELEKASATLKQKNDLSKNFDTLSFKIAMIDWNKKFEYSIKNKNDLSPSEILGLYIQKAAYCRQAEDFAGAVKYYNEIIELDPYNNSAYLNRALSYGKMNDYDNALNDATKAIEIYSHDGKAYFLRGSLWLEKHEYDKAISDFTKALEINPKLEGAIYLRGTAKAMRGDYDGSIKDFSDTIELDPKNAEAYNNRGYSWVKKGDADKALNDLNMAIELNKNEAAFYDSRGDAWRLKGDIKKSCADYEHACSLGNCEGKGTYCE